MSTVRKQLRRVMSRLSGKNEDVNGVGDYGELRRTSSPPPMVPPLPTTNGHGRSATLPPSANPIFEPSASTAPIRSHSNAVISTSARNEQYHAATAIGASEEQHVALKDEPKAGEKGSHLHFSTPLWALLMSFWNRPNTNANEQV
jgi:hypothetical protein